MFWKQNKKICLFTVLHTKKIKRVSWCNKNKTFESWWQPELLDWSLNYQRVSVPEARRHLSAGEGWWKSPENEHSAASVGTWSSHQSRFDVQLQAGGVAPNSTNKEGAVEPPQPRAAAAQPSLWLHQVRLTTRMLFRGKGACSSLTFTFLFFLICYFTFKRPEFNS